MKSSASEPGLTLSNLSSSSNTIFTEIWKRTSGGAREKMRVTINDNNKISQTKKKGPKKSTLTVNGLPTGVVEKKYDNTSTILRVTRYDFHNSQFQLQVRQNRTTIIKSLRRGFLFRSSNQRYQIKKNKKKKPVGLVQVKRKTPLTILKILTIFYRVTIKLISLNLQRFGILLHSSEMYKSPR